MFTFAHSEQTYGPIQQGRGSALAGKRIARTVCFWFCAVAAAGSVWGQGADLADPSELVGRPFTADLADRLPQGDLTTPEAAYLGHLRAELAGTLRDVLFYETGEARAQTLDGRDEASISDAENESAAETPQQVGFSSVVITNLTEQPANSPTQFIAHVQSMRGASSIAERWTVGLVSSNGLWRIDRDEIEAEE